MKRHLLLPFLVGMAVFAIAIFSVDVTAVFATTLDLLGNKAE